MIHIEHLYKTINNQTILKDISFDIKEKEVVILKGVSGSGKSTLLSILAALDKPTSGKVLIENEAIHKLPDIYLSEFRAKNIGIVFQHFNLIEHFNAKENLLSALTPTTKNLQEAFKKIDKALKQAHIFHKKDELIKNLSGGEKQRVAIARALVNNPKIIICDEPTASLDSSNAKKFLESVKEFYEMGKTTIIATHDSIFDSLEVPFRVLYMKDGELKEQSNG
jgi:putative ABC transport system ATP-binding protein